MKGEKNKNKRELFLTMGINTETFLSEKDRVNAPLRPSLDHECSSTQTAPSEVDDNPDHEDDKVKGRADQEQDHNNQEFRQKEKDYEEDEKEAKSLMSSPSSSSSSSSSSLQIKLPEFKVEDDDEDGFKTPTSSDCRIPLIPKCPPAPRKSKTKRKAAAMPARASCGQQRIKIDLSKEIFESLFSIRQDDDYLDQQIKMVRQENIM